MALDWLKPILGDKYTDEIDTKVSAEIGKNFVAKSDFNQTNEAKKKAEADVKARDLQLEQLKTASGDVDALKAQITELQQQNTAAKAEYEAQINQMRLDSIVETALTAAGAKNNKAVKVLLAEFLADAKIAADGTVKGLANEIDALAKAADTAFLFNSKADTNPQLSGMQPGDPGGNTPAPATKEPKDMSYSELCAYLAQNPNANLNNS